MITNLNPGDKAPDFHGIIQNGSTVNLKQFSGSKLVLYFYPKDLTPGCTTQAIAYSEIYKELGNRNIHVLGVSLDDEKKHCKFIDKYELKFDLISDVQREIIDSYGVWGNKKFMGREFDGIHRTTFVIDENGIIENVIKVKKVADHIDGVKKLLE